MKKKTLLIFLLTAISSLSVATAAACSSDGSKSDNPGTNITHTYGNWGVNDSDKPTQTSEGKAKSYCTDDDGVYQELTLPALSDSRYSITDNTATTEAGGEGNYTITINGVLISFYAETPVKQPEHVHSVYGKWVLATKPTYEATGVVRRYCVDDEVGYEEVAIPVLSDSRYTITGNTATSTSTGSAKFTISVKGSTVSFNAATPVGSIDQVGNGEDVGGDSDAEHTHSYGKWEVSEINKPTQSSEGKATRACKDNDGGYEEITLPALSDSRYVKTNDTATTESEGVANYTITIQGEIITFKAATAKKTTQTTAATCTVNYYNGSELVMSKQVETGTTDKAPTVSKEGYYFAGWSVSQSGGSTYNFSTAITNDISFYAQWKQLSETGITYSYAGNESAAFEWTDTQVAGSKVEYKLSSEADSAYKTVDTALIRSIGDNTNRVDVLGLKGGEYYDFKITDSSGKELNVISNMSISAYDRSGYAHFNYTEGVGAYNDDGTIKNTKNGTLVIYVSDENKNDITNSCYVNGVQTDISDYLWHGKTSIGYLLNNRQYASNTEREQYGIQALCFAYDAVAIRIIGTVSAEKSGDATVSLIEGLTAYDSTDNGGSVGDNGRMARMCNAKNLTVEGVGTDAEIYGWGIHFISNDNLNKYDGAGKSFEVRNITFANYPEDAIGMEGTQGKADKTTGSITSGASSADSDLASSVERCWIHNNSFLPGYCAKPAESDKAEGDGSCDFKRGQYFTLSYNYFTNCHKTNLVGSADASLSYNISMHHNWWNNCGSRQPLVRRANLHFYNNYISGDISTGASLNYITSARANSYVFSEANYYDGCKQAILLASGGVVKTYNNVYYACFGTNSGTAVENRDDYVANNCKFIYRNIDYSTFDTNSTLFYYDAKNKRSNCYLTDAVTARMEVMMQAGVLKDKDDTVNTTMNKTTPSSAVSTGTVDLSKVNAKGSSVVGNVCFTNITKRNGSTVTGKGQLATFTLTEPMGVSITVSAKSAELLGELVGADGKVWKSKFTTADLTLPAGTYFVASGSKDKELTISELTFKSALSDEEKVANTVALINKIPTEIVYTDQCYALINSATLSYEALSDANKIKVDETSRQKLFDAIDAYSKLRADEVISLIESIGQVNVNSNSGSKIIAARAAYNALTTTEQALVGGSYSTLVKAEQDYAAIAVTAVNNLINNLKATSEIDKTSQSEVSTWLEKYQQAYEEYENLEDDDDNSQKSQVTNISKVIDGLAALNDMMKPFNFIEALNALDSTVANNQVSDIGAVVTLYNALSDAQKQIVSSVKSKYDEYANYYTEEMAKVKAVLFYNGNSDYSSLGVTVTGNYTNKLSYEYDGKTYTTSLKMESSTTVTFTTSAVTTIKMYVGTAYSGKAIKLDGVSVKADSDGFVTFSNIAAGSHTITKGDPIYLCYMIIGA